MTSFPYPIRYILDAREMPVLSMLEKIRCQIMNRIYTKQQEARDKWTGTIYPKVKTKLDRHIDVAASCMIYPVGGIFSVNDKYGSNIVDINVRSCDCRRWQLTGIPCFHAIACSGMMKSVQKQWCMNAIRLKHICSHMVITYGL